MINDKTKIYSKGTRILGEENGYRMSIDNLASLDTLLLANYFIDHLSEEQMRGLRNKSASDAEVIIADFLQGRGAKVLDNLNNGNFQRILSSSYFDTNPAKEIAPIKEGFSDPIKLMAIEAYIGLLKNTLSKKILKQVDSKEDYKSLLFFDYLYSELSNERKSDLESKLADFENNLKNSSTLYTIQLSIPVLKKENESVKDYINELNSREEINLEDVKNYYKSGEKTLPPINFDLDKEASKLIKERTDIKGEYQDLFQNKLYKKVKRLEERLDNINIQTKSLDKEYILDKKDFDSLKSLVREIENIEEFYSVAKIKNDEISTKIDNSKMSIHKEIRLYENYLEKLNPLNAGIKKINDLKSELRSIGRDGASKYISAINSAEKLHEFAQEQVSNKYLTKKVSETTNAYTDFNNEADATLKINIEKLERDWHEKNLKLNNGKGFFFKIFKKPMIKSDLVELNVQLKNLRDCQDYLSKKAR